MGRIKDLQDKQEKGELSQAEEKELKELLKEAAQVTADDESDDSDDDSDEEDSEEEVDEEQVIEDTAKKISKRVRDEYSKDVSELKDIVKSLKEDHKPSAGDYSRSKYIVDKDLGKTSVEKLDDVKIKIPGRENKQVKEVSKRTTHFLAALVTGDREKLQVLVEGTAALGGNLVPQEFANLIVEDLRDQVVMRQFATVINVQTDTYNLPTLDTRPQVAWRSEGAVKATSTAQFGSLTLTPYSLAGIVPMSNELVADASQGVGASIVSYIARLLTQAIAEEEEEAFWTGNGSGKPTGVDNYTFTTVDAGAGASDSARADAYKKLYYRLPQGYRNSAIWAANASTWARAATLKDSQNNYLLQRLADSPVPQIMGRPAYEVNALGDGKVFFGDPSYYYIAQREGVSVDTSTEATVGGQSAFERNLTLVRVEERVDGELASTRAFVEGANMGAAF